VISLSHIALPFPPSDPLYGVPDGHSSERIHLGHLEIQGEKGLLRFPSDWLLRLRHKPFYDFLEGRALDWIEVNGTESSPSLTGETRTDESE
jgi:hypothetical protein